MISLHPPDNSVCVSPSVMSDSATPWTEAFQATLSMEFSRQECWSGLPLLTPGNLPDPGIEPGLLHCRQILYCLVMKLKVKVTQSLTLCDPMEYQDGGVGGRAFSFSCENSKITTHCWTPINKKVLIPLKKDTPHPRAKEKPQQDGRRDEIVFRSKPHICQRSSEGSNKTLCTPGDPTETESDLP